ncbi:hypothetical protein [Actinoplanes philippinensis]|uniref:hypothetical protein n=1 Tax=Actinoplanes philippinensis TaxID=35752 RepID=UPI0033D2040C
MKRLIAGLTLAWLAVLAGLAWWIFGLGMEGWSDHHSNNDVHRPDFERDVALAGGGFLVALPSGPLVIAILAYATGRRVAGTIYLVLFTAAMIVAQFLYRQNT